MSHVVLLGDSIFDNERYVPGGPAVIEHLRRVLPKGWRATLLARDGDRAVDVPGQLAGLPADATHLIVSAGGNDALEHILLFQEPASSVGEAMVRLAEMREEFLQAYRRMLEAALQSGKSAAVCTIYDAIPGLPRGRTPALPLSMRFCAGRRFRLPLIDLRLICNEASDYAATSRLNVGVRRREDRRPSRGPDRLVAASFSPVLANKSSLFVSCFPLIMMAGFRRCELVSRRRRFLSSRSFSTRAPMRLGDGRGEP